MNYETLTVRQYQEIVAIQKSDMAEEDKIILSLSTLTGMTEREIEELTIPEFNRMGLELANIFLKEPPPHDPPKYLKLNGQTYGVTYNPRQFAWYQYTDIQAWIQGNTIVNMHKIVASLLFPVKRYGPIVFRGKNDPNKHPELAEAVLDLKYMDVHAICVFFSLLWNNSIKALAASLEEWTPEMIPTERERLREILAAVGDGFITPKR